MQASVGVRSAPGASGVGTHSLIHDALLLRAQIATVEALEQVRRAARGGGLVGAHARRAEAPLGHCARRSANQAGCRSPAAELAHGDRVCSQPSAKTTSGVHRSARAHLLRSMLLLPERNSCPRDTSDPCGSTMVSDSRCGHAQGPRLKAAQPNASRGRRSAVDGLRGASESSCSVLLRWRACQQRARARVRSHHHRGRRSSMRAAIACAATWKRQRLVHAY